MKSNPVMTSGNAVRAAKDGAESTSDTTARVSGSRWRGRARTELPTALEEIHLGYVAQLKSAPVDDDTRRASASRVRQYLGHRRLDHKREVRALDPRRGPRGRRQAQKEENKSWSAGSAPPTSTASPTQRTGGSWPRSAWTPGTPPTCCGPLWSWSGFTSPG